MRVRIVSYEDVNAWILGKFARRMHEELLKLGVDADISNEPDYNADINHHIIYLSYNESKASPLDTIMITHVDDMRKFKLLERQMQKARAGICMSQSVMNELSAAGMPSDKLLFINPAHDNIMKPRKIHIGITSKVQPDGCKREGMVEELFSHISNDAFSLSIMGAGWDRIVTRIREKGFTVNYFDEFDYDQYIQLVPTFDYYLYTGQDEGSMGFIDALAAGVKTIVTPQGYHLDAPEGITFPFNEIEELVAIFKHIELEKRTLLEAVSTWTWKDYALKHLEVWQYLLGNADVSAIQSRYADGLNSMLGTKAALSSSEVTRMKQKMQTAVVRRYIAKLRNVDFLKKKLRRLIGGK